jgi:energy-converting hydrogenase Eha subunit F
MAMPSKSKTKEEQKEEKYCVQLDKDLYEWLKELAPYTGHVAPDGLVSAILWYIRGLVNAAVFAEAMKREQKDTKDVSKSW